jgi:hypothetical protein
MGGIVRLVGHVPRDAETLVPRQIKASRPAGTVMGARA